VTRELIRVIGAPQVQKNLVEGGYEPGGRTQAEYAKFPRNIYERGGEVIRDVGVKLDQGIQSAQQSDYSIFFARACRRIPSDVHRQITLPVFAIGL
jgi:hypothetical protein